MKTTFIYTALVALIAWVAPIAAQTKEDCPVDRCMLVGVGVSRQWAAWL